MADALYNVASLIHGDPLAVKHSATVAAEIKVGDFVVRTSNKAIRASSLADSGTLAQNQEAAHDVFLGISLDQKLNGDTRDILIATGGVHLRNCTALGSAAYAGDLVGLAGTGAGSAVGVSDTDVAIVATPNLAVGVLYEDAAAGATQVKVRLGGVITTVGRGAQAFA